MTRPLAPYTVVEAPTPGAGMPARIALALAGKIAADLGATVIKIEPPDGDVLRREPVLPYERGPEDAVALDAYLNTSKRAVTLDLGQAAGRDLLARIAARADVTLVDAALAGIEGGGATVSLQPLPPGARWRRCRRAS